MENIMRRPFWIGVTLSLLTFSALKAQDQHFSQFYASPLNLNPALTGTFDGKYRLSVNYREQGRNLLNQPYVTFATAMDLRFNIDKLGKGQQKDAFGLGFRFLNDRNATVNYFTNNMAVTGAFHKALSKYGDEFLSVGVELGVGQRNVNYDNFTFQDQFNGSNGYTGVTAENFPQNNFSYTDIAVGLNYSRAPKGEIGFFAGGSIYHILQPEISFYARGTNNQDVFLTSRLNRKYSAYLNLQIPLNSSISVSPRVFGYLQGKHLAANAGANFRFLVDEIKGAALHLGGWASPVRNFDNKFSMDAIVSMVGIEYSNFLIGFSYDARWGALSYAGRRTGAFEISIAYLGNYDNETVLCPKF
jgi:type IX secretion system PorP/SprF family membrane protein